MEKCEWCGRDIDPMEDVGQLVVTPKHEWFCSTECWAKWSAVQGQSWEQQQRLEAGEG